MPRTKKTKSSQLAKAIELMEGAIKELKNFNENIDPLLLDSEKLKQIRPLIDNLAKSIAPAQEQPAQVRSIYPNLCDTCVNEGNSDTCNSEGAKILGSNIIECPAYIKKEEQPAQEQPAQEQPAQVTKSRRQHIIKKIQETTGNEATKPNKQS